MAFPDSNSLSGIWPVDQGRVLIDTSVVFYNEFFVINIDTGKVQSRFKNSDVRDTDNVQYHNLQYHSGPVQYLVKVEGPMTEPWAVSVVRLRDGREVSRIVHPDHSYSLLNAFFLPDLERFMLVRGENGSRAEYLSKRLV